MPDVVVAAGVDAARNLQPQLADVQLPVEIGEALPDTLRYRDRTGVGEAAVIEPRAADHVADEAQVRGHETDFVERPPKPVEVGLLDMGEYQVLFVGDADLAEAVAVGQVGDSVHLLRRRVARHTAGGFKG